MKKLRGWFHSSLFRFLLVGTVNTLVGTLIMFGLYNFAGCSYWASSAINYTLTSIFSFFLNKHFTFENKEKNPAQIGKFAGNIVICYLVAYGLAKPLCLQLLRGVSVRARDNLSMLAGMFFFTILNYLGQKFFAFRKS